MELRPVAKRARRLYLNSPELLQQVPRRGLLSQQRRDFALESVRDLREERMPKSVSTGKQNSSVNVTISQSDMRLDKFAARKSRTTLNSFDVSFSWMLMSCPAISDMNA